VYPLTYAKLAALADVIERRERSVPLGDLAAAVFRASRQLVVLAVYIASNRPRPSLVKTTRTAAWKKAWVKRGGGSRL
jgi:hypothetical protein